MGLPDTHVEVERMGRLIAALGAGGSERQGARSLADGRAARGRGAGLSGQIGDERRVPGSAAVIGIGLLETMRVGLDL